MGDHAATGASAKRVPLWLALAVGAAITVTAGWFGWKALTPDEAPAGSREPPPFTIVAEFEGTGDEATRVAVSRLARAALDQSGLLMALPDEQVRLGLAYAGYADTATVTFRIAKELAIRGSIATLIVGAVDRLGGRYAVTAQLVDVDSGRVLASGKAEAADADGLIRAVERTVTELTRDLMSLTTGLGPRQQARLVMTPSFAAYQKYAMARRIDVSDRTAARALLHEAVALDPSFARAWWYLGILAQGSRDSSVMLIEEALRHPERLTESERYQLEAGLVWMRDEDYPRVVRLIDRSLLVDPSTPIGNKCGALGNMGHNEAAAECYDRAEARSPFFSNAGGLRNHVNSLIQVGRIADAERVAAQLQAPRRWQRYLALKIALASADWARAESLATAYLEDRTAEPWVPGRSQLTLASVYAARGAISRADSVLSRTQGAHPFGVAAARSFLLAATSHRVAPGLEGISDTLVGQLFWQVVRGLASGDTLGARTSLHALRDLSSGSDPGAARRASERSRFAEALVTARDGRWGEVVATARAQLQAWPGAELHLFARWLLATAYDRQGIRDSAVAYYTRATESAGLEAYELFYVGEPYSFSHFRLGQLYAEIGNADRAKTHFATFLETFTEPDPEYVWMVTEARAKLEELARGQ